MYSISNNPNYRKKCIKDVGKKKHENLITIWDELIKNVQP
jgi:hypothetical protein